MRPIRPNIAKVETLAGPEGTTVSVTHATFFGKDAPCRVKGGEPQSNNRRRCCMLAPMREMRFVEPKEATKGKPANDVFDAKVFLAKVGAGKQVLEFHKNQRVSEQGDVADAVFY